MTIKARFISALLWMYVLTLVAGGRLATPNARRRRSA